MTDIFEEWSLTHNWIKRKQLFFIVQIVKMFEVMYNPHTVIDVLDAATYKYLQYYNYKRFTQPGPQISFSDQTLSDQ